MSTIGALLGVGMMALFFGLMVLLVAARRGHVFVDADAAKDIFAEGELQAIDDPAASAKQLEEMSKRVGVEQLSEVNAELEVRRKADSSSRSAVVLLTLSAVMWLGVGSILGLVSSLKMHAPDLLTENAWLTFGRVRPAHLNMVAYGWLSMAGMASALWLVPRLSKTHLRGERFALFGAWLWNFAVAVGLGSLLLGITEGTEWLEFPWPVDLLFVVAGALIGVPVFLTLARRKSRHLFVSVWYIAAAFAWFPLLFLVANFPVVHFGVEHAAVNWWFAHNVLGLWFTPFALAAAYYLIPKVIGRPIHSYQLSLVGFWTLALFYSQVGIHHLIGGPVPTWLVSLSTVMSMMMVIPVLAVAINHHATMWGRFRLLAHSPTLRFVVLGAMMYTVASIQGSLHALRSLNTITHFTHYTIAHAHMGAYGFASFVFFGSVYYYLPRVTGHEWPSRGLLRVHFWSVVVGFATYFLFLSAGGLLQGLAMLDASVPFEQSVIVTKPYLVARSVGGGLMTIGHLVFAAHVLWLLASSRKKSQKIFGKNTAEGLS